MNTSQFIIVCLACVLLVLVPSDGADATLARLKSENDALTARVSELEKTVLELKLEVAELREQLLRLEKSSRKAVPDMSPFADNGNGTITDGSCGLMWTRRSLTTGEGVKWFEASRLAKTSRTGGHNDWRLPSVTELSDLYSNLGMMTKHLPPDQRDRRVLPFVWGGKGIFWSDGEGTSKEAAPGFDFARGTRSNCSLRDKLEVRLVRKAHGPDILDKLRPRH